MKRIVLWFGLGVLILSPPAAHAQGTPADWMDAALENALKKMQVYETVAPEERVDFSRNGFALYGGVFELGDNMTQEVTLSGGVDYLFLGGGDPGVIDTDIYVRTLAGDLACPKCKDTAEDSTPIIFFTPRETDRFVIDLQLFQSLEGRDSYLVLLILKRIPATGAVAQASPVDWMDQALENALKNMRLISGEIEELDFTRNGFAVYGGLYEQGDTMSQEISLSGDISYVFLAGGDKDVLDSNLFVRTPSGDLACAKCEDVEPDSYPIVVFTPSDTDRFMIELELRSSQEGRDAYLVLLILKRTG